MLEEGKTCPSLSPSCAETCSVWGGSTTPGCAAHPKRVAVQNPISRLHSPSRHPEDPEGVWASDTPPFPATQGCQTDPRHI